tara:strand:+ start:616 stop:771 length:156 start_codon:yes stop_codon:yes gene_type:complete
MFSLCLFLKEVFIFFLNVQTFALALILLFFISFFYHQDTQVQTAWVSAEGA